MMFSKNRGSASLEQQDASIALGTVPELYLIVSADLQILAASNSYLEEASACLADIQGLPVEGLFLEVAGLSSADLMFSLNQVLQSGQQQGIDRLSYFTPVPAPAESENNSWSVTNTPVMDKDGKILHIIHKVWDASEQIWQKGELELLRAQKGKQDQQHFRVVVENIPDLVTCWNREMQLVYANAAFESATGLSYTSMAWKTALEIGPEDTAIDFIERLGQVFADGKPREHFTSIPGFENSASFYTRLIPQKADDGTVNSVFGIATDTTYLKDSEQKLKESRDLMQSVFDESPNGINVFKIIFTESGDVDDFEFFMSNDTAFRILGERDLVGKRLTKEFPAILENGIFQRYKAVALTGKPADFEQLYKEEGIRRWFHFIANRLDKLLVITTEEITGRKEDELALTKSKNLLQSVIDASIGTISVRKAVRDEQNKIIDFQWVLVNEQSKIFWNDRNLLGKMQSEISPDSQKNGIFEKFVNTVEQGYRQTFEQELFMDGKVNWVLINIARLNDGLAVSSLDITERKIAEQQLKQNNYLLNSIFNSSVIGVSVFRSVRDEQGSIIDFEYLLASELTEKLLGKNNLVGKRFLKTYPNAKESGLFSKFVEIVECNIVVDEISDLAHLGTDHTWIRRKAVKLEDGLISTWLDISKQKIAENQLVRQYRILQQAEDVAGIGSWEFEIRHNKMRWSEGMFDLFGLKKEQYVYPELYLKYIIPEDKSRMKDIIRFIKKEFKPFQDEVTLKIGGRKRIFRIKASVSYDHEGKAVKVLGVAMDITERRATAEKLKQIEENRFQDILNAVITAQEEERAHIAEVLHNEFGQLLSVAKMKIDVDNLAASNLINQAILQVRTLAYDLMPDILADFGLAFALNDMCVKKLPEAGIKYSVKIKGLTKRIEPLKEVAVYRIIQELLDNAIKHSKSDMLTLEVIRKDSLLHIRLSDNGIGFQIPNKPVNNNAGFGLKYIMNRVQLHKGSFDVTAKEKGSVVSIKIPLQDEGKDLT